ncbi:hypothetical protein chiPu_0016070 [Chiloscyllium punctatum]|uniref:Ig-like domain-containing protein n=1 Tax=Chiloscyllium punctatum TaxID=137246 RepID=A0A401T4G8_CHIPU|nr:hypothetical protein [Chiloscyllium punctatum]
MNAMNQGKLPLSLSLSFSEVACGFFLILSAAKSKGMSSGSLSTVPQSEISRDQEGCKEHFVSGGIRYVDNVTFHGQYAEVVISQPRDGVIKEGEWFTLMCRYNNGFVTACWYKNNIYEDIAYQLRRKADSKTGGSYQCQNWSSSSRGETLKVVTIASDMTLTVQVHSTTLLLGETSVLKCSSYSWGFGRDYSFLWYRNNFLIEEEHEPEYTIAMARFSDGATYRCEQKLGFRKWISQNVSLIVKVPVAGVFLKLRTNKTEILIGSSPVLECVLSRGTRPYFQWYFQQKALNNVSMNYNFSSDWRELAIESFQSQHIGQYQCGAINRGPSGMIFNVTSNPIDLTLPVSSCAGAVYCSVKNTDTHNDDSKMDDSLLYSVVTISKPRNAGKGYNKHTSITFLAQ